MSNSNQVVLYGSSLFLSGVELALRRRGVWAVLRLDPAYPGAPAELAALQRGVLIYDLNEAKDQFAPAFLAAHPHMRVIGLDGAQGQAQVWRSEQHILARLDDLNDLLAELQAVGKEVGHS